MLLMQEKIDAWSNLTREIQSSSVSESEKFIMKEVVNAIKPKFNSEQVRECSSNLVKIVERLLEERRYSERNARYIEEFISSHLLDEWMVTKVTFIKAYYQWKAIEAPPGPFNALNNFMIDSHEDLWEKILICAEEGEVKYFLKIPVSETFHVLIIQGTSTMNRRVISDESN